MKHHTMKRYMEWRFSSTILDLSTRCRGMVSFKSRPLYLRGNSSRCPLDRRLGGPQSQSGRCEVEKIIFSMIGYNVTLPVSSGFIPQYFLLQRYFYWCTRHYSPSGLLPVQYAVLSELWVETQKYIY
jgi:hypothetical protein